MSKGTEKDCKGSKKKRIQKKYSMVAARIPPAIKARLKASAIQDGRTVSLQIAFAIRQFLESRK